MSRTQGFNVRVCISYPAFREMSYLDNMHSMSPVKITNSMCQLNITNSLTRLHITNSMCQCVRVYLIPGVSKDESSEYHKLDASPKYHELVESSTCHELNVCVWIPYPVSQKMIHLDTANSFSHKNTTNLITRENFTNSKRVSHILHYQIFISFKKE